ncbi:MAG: MFS transporter [Oscillospiraceae bacterium]|jgi:hypothetical protein|nr:MFS transporter [Oscillospiraceae bacterium]
MGAFRFKIRRPQIRLFDTTGLTAEVIQGLNMGILGVTMCMVFTTVTTGAPWTGYLRLLGADELTMGIIAAIPVAASTLQILASYILEKWCARRALFLYFGLFSRLSWVVIGLIPYIIPMDAQALRLMALMVLLALSSGSGAFINVGFYSLMGDLVPLRIRGRYFSARQAVSLLMGILTGLFISLLMDSNEGFFGYTLVLIIAGIFGTLDICCFFFMKWPQMQRPKGKGEGFFTMLRGVLTDKGYMRVVGYFVLWFFSVNIMGPFTNVYFLEQVQMSYTEITVINQIIPNIATVLVIGWWGRQMDGYGNQPVMQTVGLYCMLLPITYIFTGPRIFWIMPVANVLSGMAWPASDLGQQNIYLAKAPAHNRSMYVAVFFAATQLLGTALSNFVGGVLLSGPMTQMEQWGWRWLGFDMGRYDFLFILSGLLRMGCVLLLLPRLREPEDTPAIVMVRDLSRGFAQRTARYRHALWASRKRKQYRRRHMKEEE